MIKNGRVIFEKRPLSPTFDFVLKEPVPARGYFRVEVRSVSPALADLGRYPYFYAWSNPVFVER